MSRDQDVLFCKIAITNGLVSQEQAQKCLTLCERREKEGKRRPMIGAVFTKYNLMRTEDVQRIYEAVNKRLGKNGGGRGAGSTTVRRTPPVTAGASTKTGRGGRRRAKSRAVVRKMDSQTLAMGIGFGVVFIGVIGAIIYLYIRSGTQTSEVASETSGESAGGGAVAAAGVNNAGAEKSPQAGDGPQEAGAAATPPAAGVVPEEFKKNHRTAIQEARRMAYALDWPDRALEGLKGHYERWKVEYDHGAGQTYRQEVLELMKELEALAKGEAEKAPEGTGVEGLEP